MFGVRRISEKSKQSIDDVAGSHVAGLVGSDVVGGGVGKLSVIASQGIDRARERSGCLFALDWDDGWVMTGSIIIDFSDIAKLVKLCILPKRSRNE